MTIESQLDRLLAEKTEPKSQREAQIETLLNQMNIWYRENNAKFIALQTKVQELEQELRLAQEAVYRQGAD